MAKVLQQLPAAASKPSAMQRLVALLSYLHFATLQVPQHHTHHIGRIVQPQIRSLSAAMQGEMSFFPPSAKLRPPPKAPTGSSTRTADP